MYTRVFGRRGRVARFQVAPEKDVCDNAPVPTFNELGSSKPAEQDVSDKPARPVLQTSDQGSSLEPAEQAEACYMKPKLEVDLHSLMFLCTLREFDSHLQKLHGGPMSGLVILPGLMVIFLFSLVSTFIQAYLVTSLYSWNDWEAAKAAVFSSANVQELAVERLVGSMLLYFFVMPEAITALRTIILWVFLSPQNFDIKARGEMEKGGGWIIVFPMRVAVLVVHVMKLVLSIATGVLAVSICYSTPDEEGGQGILMDFTGLLIIIEIDNIMVPFALEVAELFGCFGNITLEDAAQDFIENHFRIKFTTRKTLKITEQIMKWFLRALILLTFVLIVALIVFERISLGKCHVDDFAATWTGEFMTLEAKSCPDTHPEPSARCLNYDMYSKCSPTSSFCDQLLSGRIDDRTIFLELTQCY